MGPAAERHPDINFVAYHSGFEAGVPEVPYTKATRTMGTNRLIWSMEREGVSPNENVYAEMGTSWWFVMRYPDQAAHFLGKLLRYVGEDNVLWGTDRPVLRIPAAHDPGDEVVPDLARVPGALRLPDAHEGAQGEDPRLNGAALYGVEPNAQTCEFSRRDLEQIRITLPGRNRVLGPTTMAETRAFRNDDREQWATMASFLA
ncbi:MAG: amidohydrolase [Actinomycetota bacterium]|nr:amidohydrolase [Actinomycetota bacterium]